LTALFELLVADPKIELSSALKKVYPETLARYHAWLVKKTVGAGEKSERTYGKTVGAGEKRGQLYGDRR
jgi:hypothetical protein